MLFNSYVFIFLFLPVTFAVWRALCAKRKLLGAIYWLLAASLFFYGYWNPPYLLLLLASIAVNFMIQKKIAESRPSKLSKKYMIAGVALNLALIGYYKYANFFAENLAPLFGAQWQGLEIFLPLGISFFTFQQIACLVDTYHGKLGVMPFRHYALFVSFFPQLIAGPIVLADEIIPQFSDKKIFALSWKNIYIGAALFAIGLFKKVAIADTFSPYAAIAFDEGHVLTFIDAWGGALAYTLQLYFDFSGYSDMAMGLASFFNIKIPQNFNSPYKSTSIIEFWRRWHMTLSAFLRDYLYIPLGGNRKGKARRYINLTMTMLLGGLWHGAGWTFVIWGGLHGLFLVINHFWRAHCPVRLPKFAGWLITSVSIVAAWVFFRAETVGQALLILKGMAGLNGFLLPAYFLPSQIIGLVESFGVPVLKGDTLILCGQRLILYITLAVLACTFLPNATELAGKIHSLSKSKLLFFSMFIGCILTYLFLCLNNVSEFLYFQF